VQINRTLTCPRRRRFPRALAEISHAFDRLLVRNVYEAPKLGGVRSAPRCQPVDGGRSKGEA